ncbi:carbon storage regulator CsrA [Pilimelia columellifera]|uniref:Translational regulator CsrA n=1 Tax=Pilimelia columellifera subsp. columellifera TaxID=706583 RepID=A0ABP6AGE9_9ACTN
MLVLTRRPGESIHIGDEVIVTVLETRGDVVRIGVRAPRVVQVHREEVYRELQAANRAAASPSDNAVRDLTRLLRPGKPADHPGKPADQPGKPTG